MESGANWPGLRVWSGNQEDAHAAGEALTVKQVPHPRDVATAPGLLARSDVTLSDADHRRE
jgi:hypothetical protein